MKMYEAALASCNQSIALNGTLAEQYVNRGVAYLNLERYTEALVDFDHALSIRPDNVRAQLCRAKVFYKTNQKNKAIEAAGKAINMRPDFADAHHLYGILLITKGRKNDGCRHVEIACELHDSYACQTLGNICKK